jgi:PilZ domain
MGESAGTPTDSGAPNTTRRAVPRYTLIATAEIIDLASEMRMSGRISEISRQGCYVDVLNALPVDSLINVRISRDQGTFFSPGKIIYIQEGMGMGVAFHNSAADQLQVLDLWLAELTS